MATPASTTQALQMVLDGLSYLAAADPAVLESLSAPMGAEDTRTREQRYHDGLAGTKGLRDGPFGPDRHAGPIMH